MLLVWLFGHSLENSQTTLVIFLCVFQDSELNELRKTIELLKKQNAAAQAAINGVINTPELTCKGKRKKQPPLLMTAQHSEGIHPLDNS